MDLNIYAKETALVLIDMQNIAMQFYSNSNPDIVAKCREMVDFAHENGIKVIYTQLNRRADVKDQTINRSELNISLGSIEPAPVYVEGTKEAAIIDGCNIFEMFVKVCLPLVKSSLAVLAIFTFIGSWGEFLWPSIVLTKDCMYTLPVGINNLQGLFSSNWRFIAAGSILATIPIVIFFLAMQKYFISGENEGAVKG